MERIHFITVVIVTSLIVLFISVYSDDDKMLHNKKANECNLYILHTSILSYSEEYEGVCPPDLGVLFDSGFVKGAIFVSPNSSTKIPSNGNDVRNGLCDYLYFGKDKVIIDESGKIKASIPLLSTKKGVYPDAYLILYSERIIKEVEKIPNNITIPVK